MRIGNLPIPEGAGLAPMAGVTDACFRPLCFELGAAFSVSEMLSAKGFLHASNARQVGELLLRADGEGILGLQLFGHEPELMAEAAHRLEGEGFQFIDINMGCPTHKIVANGDGAALMKAPERAGKVVRAVARACRLPVTVKIRSGWDEGSVNAPLVAKIAQDNGASAVAVHGRTRSQFYGGRADWGLIARVKRAVSIPVIGNGDVASGADALRMLGETGVDAVMVGRAARGNPWIFEEILCALRGEPYQRPDMRRRVRMALRHMDSMVPVRGERGTLLEMRKHVAWYLAGGRGCAQLRGRINALEDLEQVRGALHRYMEELDQYTTEEERR